jgi:hypothetical protein
MADLKTEMAKLAMESYSRGMEDGVKITIEGFEELANQGLAVFQPGLLETVKRVALGAVRVKTATEKSLV